MIKIWKSGYLQEGFNLITVSSLRRIKQESIRIENSSSEGAIIRNQAPEGAIATMVVIKWSDAIKEPIVKVDVPLCGGLYKEDHGSIVTWSGTNPYAKLNCFT